VKVTAVGRKRRKLVEGDGSVMFEDRCDVTLLLMFIVRLTFVVCTVPVSRDGTQLWNKWSRKVKSNWLPSPDLTGR